MARKLSCQERVSLRIKALLEEITVAHGYNTTVTGVKRYRGTPKDRDNAPEINMWFGDIHRFDIDGNALVEIRGPLAIAYSTWVADGDDPDTESEMLSADIQKALVNADLQSTQIFVASGTVGHASYAVDCNFIAHATHSFDENGGQIVCGVLVYEVAYRRLRMNPNLFSSDDTAVDE